MSKVNAIPKGYHTVTPGLTVSNAKEALEFYAKAFGAEQKDVCMDEEGKRVMHAELKIGDSMIMLNDEFPQMGCVSPKTLGNTPVNLYIYVDNVDAWFERATKAGATVTMPLSDMFWGDRYGQVMDPFGYKWGMATHISDPTPEQIKEGQEAWSKMQKEPACAK